MRKQETIKVTHQDLPIQCPQKNEDTTALHPTVYLPIDKFTNNKVTCYYCSQTYELVDTK